MHLQIAVVLSCTVGALADLYSLAATIPWAPKTPSSVDQSVIYNGTYYLSDRSNAGIHVVALSNNTQTTIITGFVTGLTNGTLTPAISGPNGLIILPNRNELYSGDGDGTVKVVNLFTNKVVANITTGSKKRSDEFAYDPSTNTIIVTNANESPPFVTVIDANARRATGRVTFPGASGLEQPRFNTNTSTFYVSVPGITGNMGGAVITLNLTPGNFSIAKVIPVPQCDNAGIAFGSGNNLFVGCSASQITDFGYGASYIIDGTSGAVLHNITGVSGIDQVAYSSTTGFFYATCYQYVEKGVPMPFVAVVASNGTVVQKIVTDNVTAHAVAADPSTGSFLVPVKAKGILRYSMGSATTSGSGTSTSSGGAASATASSAAMGRMVNVMGLVVALFGCALVFC